MQERGLVTRPGGEKVQVTAHHLVLARQAAAQCGHGAVQQCLLRPLAQAGAHSGWRAWHTAAKTLAGGQGLGRLLAQCRLRVSLRRSRYSPVPTSD